MSQYDLHKDFAKLANMQPPVSPKILPFVNTLMSFMPYKRCKGVRKKSLRIPSFDAAKIKLRIFSPKDLPEKAPCLVYFHGGGFAIKAASYHYELAQTYALEAHCHVAFLSYRLAPKHPFPTAPKDCFAAWNYLVANADALGIDPDRMAVGGDSAGGNLAAVCALMARDMGCRIPCFQLLIYPVTDRRMNTASMSAFPDTPMWNAKKNDAMWALYAPDLGGMPVEYASPMEAETLRGLPSAYVETAEFDCLRDEGANYAAALQRAGSTVEVYMTKGTVHGFDTVKNSSVVERCVDRRVLALRKAFSK